MLLNWNWKRCLLRLRRYPESTASELNEGDLEEWFFKLICVS